jgi:hypothetical protein
MRKRVVKKIGAGSEAEASTFVVTTVRLGRAQWNALRKAALERALAKGGKADASAVLRELVDEWMRRS